MWVFLYAFIYMPWFLFLEKHVTTKYHVMQTALPAAITMVVTLLVVQVLSPFWKETEVFTYTFDLLVGGAVGIMVVFRVCRPLNWLRGILCVCVIAVFSVGVLLFPGFLGIHSIFCWQMVMAIPLVCMAILLYHELIRLILCCYRIRDRIHEKLEILFPKRKKKKSR